jgi:hypothetical protein
MPPLQDAPHLAALLREIPPFDGTVWDIMGFNGRSMKSCFHIKCFWTFDYASLSLCLKEQVFEKKHK